MALEDNQLFSTKTGRGAEIRLFPTKSKVGTLAAQSGDPLLPKGTPLAYNRSSDLWTVYTQPSATVASFTLTRDAGAGDGGAFSLSIDGLSVDAAWDIDTATLLAAINDVLADADKDYSVTVANSGSGTDLGTSGNVQTVAFSEVGSGAPTVTADMSGLTDGLLNEPSGIVLAIVAAGTELDGTDEIRGLVMDMEGIQTDASNEVQLVVMLEGEAHRDDINTAAILLVLGGSPTEAELDTALRSQKIRGLSLHIRGLSNVS